MKVRNRRRCARRITNLFLSFVTLVLPLSYFLTNSSRAQDRPAVFQNTKRIRSITVNLKEIFEDPNYGFLYRSANDLKISTKEQVVRRELLFKEGDPYNEFLIKETERNLRLQRYLRQVTVTATFDGDFVDIVVNAQDTWTLIPYLSFSSGTGKNNRGIGLSESDVAGTGKRVETRYQEDDSRKSYAAVYDDRQFLGTTKQLTAALFDRSDGQIFSFSGGQPFKSLLQKESWFVDIYNGDSVGRLFENGDEEYIFRQQNEQYSVFYTIAGPGRNAAQAAREEYSGIYQGIDILSSRYSVGFDYTSDTFEQADADDYDDLDLDPRFVSNDINRLASNRRFVGPAFRYQKIHPNYISMNYIDRFDRVEDYNLGDEYLFTTQLAGRMFGSSTDSILFSGNRSRGWRFSPKDFLRGELGFSSRLEDGTLKNSLLRGEIKYYNVLGDLFVRDVFLGRHTFAVSSYVDFGEDFDRDRQFLLGSDNALRGYEANTFEGDKRLVLNIEERTHLADDVLRLFSVGTAVFFDTGGTTRDTLGSIVLDDMYSSAGFGLRFGFPRSAGGGVVRVDIAFPLRDGPDGSNQFEPRIIFAAGQLFGARLRSEVVGAENASVGVGFDR